MLVHRLCAGAGVTNCLVIRRRLGNINRIRLIVRRDCCRKLGGSKLCGGGCSSYHSEAGSRLGDPGRLFTHEATTRALEEGLLVLPQL